MNSIISIATQFLALSSVNHLLIGGVFAFELVFAPRLGMWAFSLFSLPGTSAHELCHWLVARVLGAQPSFPNLIPKREGSTWVLGSVRVSPNIFTRIPIALAPFGLLPLGIWYAVFIMTSATGWWYLAHVWIAGTLLAASLPSKQDWFVAMPAIVIALVLFFALRELGYV